VRQLEIKVLNIIDAQCNHEVCPDIQHFNIQLTHTTLENSYFILYYFNMF